MSRPPSPAEAALIRQLMRETEQLRGLPFRAPVEVRIQDRVAVRAYVTSALAEDELLKARRRYVALGLLQPGLDIRELIESLMEEELIGYYDPVQKMLAVREEVASSLARGARGSEDEQWKATVVHELVHALQDQHLGLSESMLDERTTDQENAFSAVVEGDATLAMLGYLAARQGGTLDAIVRAPDELAIALRSGQVQVGGKLERAPALVREPLLFRYREGTLFAARLYARGGWRQVNEAHHEPPPSTLVVRDPRVSSGAAPLVDELPEPPALEAQGCRAIDRDVLGSLEVGAALTEQPGERDQLARAWRGDRYVVLTCERGDASVWYLRFASLQAARRARLAFQRHESAARRVLLGQGRHLLAAFDVPSAALPALNAALRAWTQAKPR